MLITLQHNTQTFTADLSKPIDISIPLKSGTKNPNCFYAPPPLFIPFQEGNFIGDTKQGSPVNFYNIQVNPHGNGTHTECVGHIAQEEFFINGSLKQFHSIGLLITIAPEKGKEDFVITKEMIASKLEAQNKPFTTLIVRTLPNTKDKLDKNYSNTNPPYFTTEAMEYIVNLGVEHLIVDLPSVDKEKDEGKLAAHHIFWKYPNATRENATITELVYIPNEIKDGLYFINIQIMPIELDASCSKIVLYELKQ